MDNFAGYILTAVLSVLVGYLLQYLELKPKVVWWRTNEAFFHLKDQKIALYTHNITISNKGRRQAKNIEIIHRNKPDFFVLQPALNFEEDKTPSGEHIIRIQTLGPKELFTIQFLSYQTLPELMLIRSDEGQGQFIQIQLQRIFPKWLQATAWVPFLAGIGFLIYWLIKAILFISSKIL